MAVCVAARPLHPSTGKCLAPGTVSPAFPFFLLSWNPLCHAVLGLAVRSKWPPCQVLPILRAYDPLPLSLFLAPLCPHHSPGISFFCPYPNRLEWIVYYPHCFAEIRLQSHKLQCHVSNQFLFILSSPMVTKNYLWLDIYPVNMSFMEYKSKKSRLILSLGSI